MTNDLTEIVACFKQNGAPSDQSALLACLREAQEVCGGMLDAQVQQEIASLLGVKPNYLQAIAKRISDLKLSGAAHTLTVCTGANCSRRGVELRRYLEDELGVQNGKPFLNGRWIYRTAGCQRACPTSPNVRIDGQLVTGMTLETLKKRLSES